MEGLRFTLKLFPAGWLHWAYLVYDFLFWCVCLCVCMGKYYKLPLQSLELPLLTVVFLCLGLDQSFVHGEVPDSESVTVVVLSGAFLSACRYTAWESPVG